MLFNSNPFLFLFLPIALIVFFALARGRASLAIAWLVAASLFFYGWWNPSFLLLLAASIVVNYGVGRAAQAAAARAGGRPAARAWVVAGVVFDLGLIGWFKYANFGAEILAAATGRSFELPAIALPLAISFFTFQQIAFVVDCGRGEARETRFLHYCLFVTFFPQLISGPIVHHREMMPQFEGRLRFRAEDFAVGLTLLAIGLFKKTVLADGIAEHSSPVFDAAARGVPLGAAEAWLGGLGYTLQLYFDFSGYSDMALGLARMFGIKLPLNFHSPLKAESIIEFWRRWHMTLSRFLRDYLYFFLGGNRRGVARRWLNLMITMVLGGLWHGASGSMLLWGALHGGFLVVNHAFRGLKARLERPVLLPSAVGGALSRGLTFLVVMLAFVVFRAESVGDAGRILLGMLGANGAGGASVAPIAAGWLAALLAIAWGLPNSQQILRDHEPGLDVYGHLAETPRPASIRWRPSPGWAAATCLMLVAAIFRIMVEGHVEFLYRFF